MLKHKLNIWRIISHVYSDTEATNMWDTLQNVFFQHPVILEKRVKYVQIYHL